MSDTFRYKSGETNPVFNPVDSAQIIEIGDLVFLNTDDVRAASQFTWGSSLAITQESFHDAFLGVAEQRSRSGDTDDIRVSTEGEFEFECDAATFEIGDLVGPADSGSSSLEDQKVVAVATENLAIGRVARRYASNTTVVRVRIKSTVMLGGPQAAA